MDYNNLRIIHHLDDVSKESTGKNDAVFTGVRPSNNGKLHLGHLMGFGKTTKALQKHFSNNLFIIVADYQAISDKPHKTGILEVKNATGNTIIDILSVLDNAEDVSIFKETEVIDEIAILKNLLEQYCTIDDVYNQANYLYKNLDEQKVNNLQKGKDNNISLLLYHLGQMAQIVGAGTDGNTVYVPSGPDQNDISNLANVVLERIGAKYDNNLMKVISICEEKEILGINGKKMGKSENNTINLDDPEEVIKQKINIIEHRNVFSNYGEFLFDNDFVDTLPENLTLKEIDHLRNLIFQKMIDVLKPIQEKIKYYGEHKEEVENLLERGTTQYKGKIQKNIDTFKNFYLSTN